MVTQGTHIAVLGAGGAIGGHVVRGLLDAGYSVTAVVRSLGSAVRIGRYDIQIHQCDIASSDVERLAAVLKKCDALIDCTYSTLAEIDEQIAQSRLLAQKICQAAKLAGLKKIVHYGTISVYPKEMRQVSEETVCSPQGDAYADAKLAAQQVFLSRNTSELNITVLQLPVVIGPFMGWTAAPAAQMSEACLVMPDDLAGVCTPIDVADVVSGTLLTLQTDRVAGECILLHNNSELNWSELYAAYANGDRAYTCKTIDRAEFVALDAQHQRQRQPWQRLKQRFSNDGDFRQLLLAQWGIRSIYQALRRRRGQAGMDELKLRIKPDVAQDDAIQLLDPKLFAQFDAMPAIRSNKAEQLLGFSSSYTFDETLQRCAQWLKWNGSGS